METQQNMIDEVNKHLINFKNGIFFQNITNFHTLKRVLYKMYPKIIVRFCIFPKQKCEYCGDILSIQDMVNWSGGVYSVNGYRSYCQKCFNKGLPEKARREKLSMINGNWAKTTEGIASHNKQGQHNSIALKKFFKTEKGIELQKRLNPIKSIKIKERIKSGKWTPCITNSWTHWEAKVIVDEKEHRFRSSWEACFFVCHPLLSYETLRIPYIDDKNEEHVYVADFYDETNRILYELKPKSAFLDKKYKMDRIIEHCLNNKIQFIWINENNILGYVDKSKFSSYNLVQYEKMLKGVPKCLKELELKK